MLSVKAPDHPAATSRRVVLDRPNTMTFLADYNVHCYLM